MTHLTCLPPLQDLKQKPNGFLWLKVFYQHKSVCRSTGERRDRQFLVYFASLEQSSKRNLLIKKVYFILVGHKLPALLYSQH